VKGSVYEIVLFHAERHTTQSNFKLTLSGFLAPRSTCAPICGDELVVGGEECDDGDENTASPEYGKCTAGTCALGPYCGDGNHDVSDGEACDTGATTIIYGDEDDDACAPGCVLPAACGDGKVDPAHNEECDDGANTGEYGTCNPDCSPGPYCGDGIL